MYGYTTAVQATPASDEHPQAGGRQATTSKRPTKTVKEPSCLQNCFTGGEVCGGTCDGSPGNSVFSSARCGRNERGQTTDSSTGILL